MPGESILERRARSSRIAGRDQRGFVPESALRNRWFADSALEETRFEQQVPHTKWRFFRDSRIHAWGPPLTSESGGLVTRGPMVRIPFAPAGSPLQTPLARAECASASAGSSAIARRGVPSARG